MKRYQRIFTILLCICFLAASVLPAIFTAAHEMQHEAHQHGPAYEDEPCDACVALAGIVRAAKLLRANLGVACALPLFALLLYAGCVFTRRHIVPATPISLKIQMNR